MKPASRAVLYATAFTVLSSRLTQAEGFRDATTGAFDLGRSGGRIAQVADSTAVQNNPANLMDINTAQAEFDPSIIYIKVHYTSPDGTQAASTLHPLKALPNFFASIPFDDNRFAFGFGVTVPFGLANQWNDNATAFSPTTPPAGGNLTYASAYYSKLTTMNFNPTLAAKLGDHLQIGVGLDVMWSDLEFKQFVGPGVFAHADGDGVGVGGNLGVTWKITDHQRLAATYRSTMTVDYSGTVTVVNYPGNPQTSFDSQIKYPNIFSVGYGIDLTDTIRLESDVEWLQFSQFKNLGITTGMTPIGSLSQNVPENWHNTFTAGIGGDWQFADHWVLRAGYQYFESPVPDSTFSPTIPDANQNVLTVGIGWQGRHSSLEFAYGLDFYDERNINNPTAPGAPTTNGKYTFNVHLFSLAYRYSF